MLLSSVVEALEIVELVLFQRLLSLGKLVCSAGGAAAEPPDASAATAESPAPFACLELFSALCPFPPDGTVTGANSL